MEQDEQSPGTSYVKCRMGECVNDTQGRTWFCGDCLEERAAAERAEFLGLREGEPL